ncbi:MAG: ABC transporter permease, partial [Pseudorhodoplanes sp.]
VLTVGHRLQAIPRVYEEAALTLGANRVQTFTSTVLPLMYPAVFAGLVLAFVMSFDEVTATLFWLPANTQTVQTAIFSILQVEISPKVNALASVLIALTVLALGLAMLLRTKPASRA